MITTNCDKCKEIAKYVQGAGFERIKIMHMELDLCYKCEQKLKTYIYKWLK